MNREDCREYLKRLTEVYNLINSIEDIQIIKKLIEKDFTEENKFYSIHYSQLTDDKKGKYIKEVIKELKKDINYYIKIPYSIKSLDFFPDCQYGLDISWSEKAFKANPNYYNLIPLIVRQKHEEWAGIVLDIDMRNYEYIPCCFREKHKEWADGYINSFGYRGLWEVPEIIIKSRADWFEAATQIGVFLR